ncbi:MAG: DUF1566 domain-containing protein, partial [Aestuariibacter sp.]|nr:DUF1566 domain-containing protein [Aestuariibacter sp.]
ISNTSLAVCQVDIPASTPDSQLQDNGDGTVTDNKTGLMWKQCSEGLSGADCATGAATTHQWNQALQIPETLNPGGGFAGYSDWRLPNIKELRSIVEYQCSDPAINSSRFPATASSYYWSSSASAVYSSNAWCVHFNDGRDNNNGRSNGSRYVRLVRAGQ